MSDHSAFLCVLQERLERHVSLSSSAAASGATPQFFQKMRQQGSIV
jgi:hypothetical protein